MGSSSFFKIVLQSSINESKMYVPGKFVNAHLGADCSCVKVIDSGSSKDWVVRLNRRERGGLNLGLGWIVFRADNDLKPGDVCLFELVNPGECLIKAHIFRVSAH
ncbi:B3 domain-containing transcription factor VRN1 [Linum grandiflorum]